MSLAGRAGRPAGEPRQTAMGDDRYAMAGAQVHDGLHLCGGAGQGAEAGGEVFRVMAGVDLVHAGFVAHPLGAEEGGQFGAKGFCGCGHGAPSMFSRA